MSPRSSSLFRPKPTSTDIWTGRLSVQIILKEPSGPYKCEIDTDVMEVELRKVFLGVRLVTDDGDTLSICMRDHGFELVYDHFGKSTEIECQSGIVMAKEGEA